MLFLSLPSLILTTALLVMSLKFTQTILQGGHARSISTGVHDLILVPNMAPMAGHHRLLSFSLRENSSAPSSKCQPVHNIAFVKTHKAGSSTIANILQRYGITHDLTFALPNKIHHTYGYNYISKPGDILTKEKVIPLPRGQEYNILFNHAIYNRTAFQEIMPKNTSYITILREPFQQFVSAFEYYHVDRIFASRNSDILNETNPISAYLADPMKFERGVGLFSYIKNKQAEDLGMSREEFFRDEKLKAYIAQMDVDFSLVMIMEYFDESLLLLKRQLCWETKDILYIPKNKNRHKPYRNFTSQDYTRHKKISHLDYSLYSHYSAIFRNKLNDLGEDFSQELVNFKQLLGQVKSSCLVKRSLHVTNTRWHAAFDVTQRDCELMMLSELAGLDKLFARAHRAAGTPELRFNREILGKKMHTVF